VPTTARHRCDPLRDLILDRTPFLQKVVGESSLGEIIAQVATIDEAEKRFAAIHGGRLR
jgi:hypothetical protein